MRREILGFSNEEGEDIIDFFNKIDNSVCERRKFRHVISVKVVSFSDSGEAPEPTRVGVGLAVD